MNIDQEKFVNAFHELAIIGVVLNQAADVSEEIIRARALHGEQKHLPLIDRRIEHDHYADMAEGQKAYCKWQKKHATPTWDVIALEEVYEFFEALQAGDLQEARTEGIQAIAMLTSMVELIDEKLAEQ